jgi:hypothetical protein
MPRRLRTTAVNCWANINRPYGAKIKRHKKTHSMQFTISTLFLIFFNVAASLALFGRWGLILVAGTLLSAFIFNRARTIKRGIFFTLLFLFILISPFLLHTILSTTAVTNSFSCIERLKIIWWTFGNYQEAYKHYPASFTVDSKGNRRLSWRMQILPFMYPNFYDTLKQILAGNASREAKILLGICIPEYVCPAMIRNKEDCTTNYLAVIGPGTAWREDGPIELSDFPDGGAHTIMLVEVANSGVHWAEPRDLTVDEALENMIIGKGLRISSPHPNIINVLFADGTVRSLPSKMPISLWKKIFAGEVKDLDHIEKYIDESAPDMVDVSVAPAGQKAWTIILSAVIWLLSIALLFHRAIKSRRKPAVAT